MKRALILMSAVAITAAFSGCNGSDQTPANTGQAENGPAWKLAYNTSCADGTDQCVGKYGFTVSADGKYLVGPSSNGQFLSGDLAPDEFSAIKDILAKTESTDSATGEACQNAADDMSAGESLVLTRHATQKQLMLVRDDSQVCVQSANLDSVTALHTAILNLANKYYTLPFPDPCNDAISALSSLYQSLQGCSTDADCVYVADAYSFSPVTAGEATWVTANSCTTGGTLEVANGQALAAHLQDLTDVAGTLHDACGARYQIADCTQTGFDSSKGAPVCQAGVCRVNPSIQPSSNGNAQ